MRHSRTPFGLIVATIVTALISRVSDAQGAWRNVSVSVTVASDYFAYGLSQTNGNSSWRLAADYQHPSGFFAGGNAGNVEFETEYGWRRPRDSQLNVYGGYRTQGTDWTANVAAARYIYPGLAIDYDYSLVSAGAAFRDRVFFGIAYSARWLGVGSGGLAYDFGFAQPLGWDLELGANAGRVDIDSFPSGAFSHWDVGLSKLFDRFVVDLRYHESSTDNLTLLGNPGGPRLALSVTYAIAPRSP